MVFSAKFRIQGTVTVGEGTPLAALKTVDVGANYTDYTSQVTDGSAATNMPLGALDTVANGDWVIVRFGSANVRGLRFDMGTNVNANAATLAVEFWNGTAWTAVSGLVDGTAIGGATLAQDGTVFFSYPGSTWSQNTVNGTLGYHIRVSVSALLSAVVDVNELAIRGRTQILDGVSRGSTLIFMSNHSAEAIYWGDENVLPGDVAQDNGGSLLSQGGVVTIDDAGTYVGQIWADVGSTSEATAIVSRKQG